MIRAEKDSIARIDTERKISVAKLEAERSKLAACRGDKLRRDSIYETALKRCTLKAPFWRSPILWTAIGAAVGGGVCGLGVGASR